VSGRVLGGIVLVEVARLVWKGFLEGFLAQRPSRRRFREL
jgi:hypothetical protein